MPEEVEVITEAEAEAEVVQQPIRRKVKVSLPEMTCPYPECGKTWNPRTSDPIRCPRCGRPLKKTKKLLGRKKVAKEQVEQNPDENPTGEVLPEHISPEFDGTEERMTDLQLTEQDEREAAEVLREAVS